jgi:hypothetical protein
LRVLDERLVQPGLQRVGGIDDRGQVVGDHRAEHATEEHPRRFEPDDHRLGGLPVTQPHEAVPAVTGREDERVRDPVASAHRIGDQAHATEVDLQLVARLAVRHPHRRCPATAAATHLEHIALHRPARDHHTPAAQQIMDLHCGEIRLHPLGDLIVVGGQQPPRLTAAVDPMGTHRLDHHADQHVGQLLLATVPNQPGRLTGGHVAADRLAVQPHQPLDRPDALASQPQPQNLSHLEHANLPERHRRLPNPADRYGGDGTFTGTGAGGPRKVVPSQALGWSHTAGATQLKVVPCGWRATALTPARSGAR